MKLYIDYEVSVAGYSNSKFAHKIFLMPEKKVPGVSGTSSMIQFMESANPAYINANGGDKNYFLVGKKFLRISNMEQRAWIANALLAAGNVDEVTDVFGDVDVVAVAANLKESLYDDSNDVAMVPDALYRLLCLSGLFGYRTAKKVVEREFHELLRTGRMTAKNISKVIEVAKMEKADLRATKATNKAVAKDLGLQIKSEKADLKAEAKAEKVAAKEARKAEKEAKKAEKAEAKETVDLDAAAAAI
jgi:hypothetical protein